MLHGPTTITLDAKGRLSMPTKYREQIAARCGGHLVCTVDLRRCLLIYPLPDWEETERKLSQLPSLIETAQQLSGVMLGYATDVELDGHARLQIPKVHRKFVGLDRQAMMFGQGNKFAVWDEDRWNDRINQWMDSAAKNGMDLNEELEKFSY